MKMLGQEVLTQKEFSSFKEEDYLPFQKKLAEKYKLAMIGLACTSIVAVAALVVAVLA